LQNRDFGLGYKLHLHDPNSTVVLAIGLDPVIAQESSQVHGFGLLPSLLGRAVNVVGIKSSLESKANLVLQPGLLLTKNKRK